MKWSIEQFTRAPVRRRAGRPSQDSYAFWQPDELDVLRACKGRRGGYRVAAQLHGRSWQSCKAKGASL